MIRSSSLRSFMNDLEYLILAFRREMLATSGSLGIIGLKGSLKKECRVWPPALTAAIPVGASTTNFFFVVEVRYLRNVDFPVPAFPVRKTDCEVNDTSCRAF